MSVAISTPKNRKRSPNWKRKFVFIGYIRVCEDTDCRYPGAYKFVMLRTMLTRRSSAGMRLWCFPENKKALTMDSAVTE